jgi:membrane protease YdiL (CAAX protease family)
MRPALLLLRHAPLLAYFVLAYAASAVALLVIGLPRLDGGGGLQVTSLFMFPVMVVAAGLAGVLMTAVTDGRSGLRALRERMTRWRLGWWWLILLLPPLAILLVLTALRLFISPNYAPQLLLFGIGAGVLAGFCEELGWSGFAYPRLSARFGALGGALVLGVLWALWHFPVLDSLGAASPHASAWPAFFAAFAAALIALRVLIAWLYTNTESVLGAQLLHASSTASLVVFGAPAVTSQQEALWYAAYAVVLWIAVAVVVARYGATLTRGQHHHASVRAAVSGPLDVAARP